MRYILLALTTCICFQVPAIAQDKSDRTCRILFLGAPDNAPQKLFLSDGKSSQVVELPSMNLSPVYALAAGDITLTMLLSKPLPDVPLPDGAPKGKVAEGMADVYLLVASDPANKIAPVRFQVINANADGFKNGQLLWFNLSPHRIGGKIGTENLSLAPNSKAILKAPAGEIGDYPVKVGYMPEGTDRAEPLCETIWQHDPRTKNIVFVMQVPGSRIPRVMGFQDFREIKADSQQQ